MINRLYKLISPGQFVVDFEEVDLSGEKIIIRPEKLSICAADQRYYTGKRERSVLSKKLPMALIHEGVGRVIYDNKGEFKPGDKVVMIPTTPIEKDEFISENYLKSSKFRSSGFDGFTQDYILMDRDRVLKYDKIDSDIASFIELISVAFHAINRFEKKSSTKKETLGIWGDGNLGFIISLVLKNRYPDSNVIVFGKNQEKLSFFSFVDEVYRIDEIPENLKIDHGFEAVGGVGSNFAINQMIDLINPEGCMILLGVSENQVEINTRLILEKGLILIGNSRSTKSDFEDAIYFLEKNTSCQNHLQKLVSQIININSIQDLTKSFERDLASTFKTVLNWNL
ncbi:alcohol dehydrogenase catalytic domain-containing protein [Paraclostridium bifermentans]|uniref:alcohol dehydrogenase catalytic domain-containing protein n=2 Tax=Paraclostridium TaxID=1849822 RepID=UPI0003FF52B2|nr:alcohol dehydrogenase catalytic domain-containing protein [Paraclostridium bifermentans]